MASLALVFDILAKDSASSTFRQVGDEAERTGKRAESGLGSIVSAAKVAGAALLGAGIIGGFRSLYDAAAESARITALTENAIRSTGGAAKISASQVGDLAAAISNKTGVDDEAIQSGQNLLLTFTNVRNEVGAGNDIFNQASQALVDMSTVLGTDASGSAIQLGKALNDPIKGVTSLSRAGVQFTEQQKEQIRTLVESGDVLGAQKIILGELTTQFGGAAEAAATPLDKLQVSVGNIAETIGAYLIPVVGEFAEAGLTAIEGVAAGFESGEVSSEGFAGAMEGLGVAVGDVAEAVGFLAGLVGDVGGFFIDLPGPVQAGVAAFAAFTLLKGPVSAAFETIALKALYARDSIVSAGTGMGGLRGAASGVVGLLGGPWGLAIGAATVGLGFLTSALSDSDDASAEAETAQRAFADAVRESNGVIDESVRSAAAKAAADAGLLDIAEQLDVPLSRVTDAVLGNRDAYTELNVASEAYLQETLRRNGQNTEDATFLQRSDAVAGFRGTLEELIPTVANTRAEQEQLTAATEGTDLALGGATPTVQSFADVTAEMQQQVSDAKGEVDALKLSLDILTGANVSLIDVQSAFYDSLAVNVEQLANLEGAVATATGGLNLQSEAGRFASDVLLDVRNSGNDLIATMLQQGATAEDVAEQETALRDSFIATAGQMGFNEDQAAALADQILGIPSERATTITADTTQALGAVNDFVARVSGTRVVLTGDFVGGAGVNVRRAAGGAVFGAGTATSDSIPAWLSNGEYVVKAASVGKYGMDFMDALNAGNIAAFAEGGLASRYAIPVDLSGLSGISVEPSGAAGSGSVGGGWQSIWEYVKARVPQARINSTFRPGDPGYHGRGKAIDFGFGSGPGGAGSPGLALINRVLHDGLGRNLAELIYDGIGDDRPDLKNGRPLTYSGATRNQHQNHVHAATYDDGGLLRPGYTLAYNGTGQSETIRTAEQEAALVGGPVEVTGRLTLDPDGFVRIVDGRIEAMSRGLAGRGVR